MLSKFRIYTHLIAFSIIFPIAFCQGASLWFDEAKTYSEIKNSFGLSCVSQSDAYLLQVIDRQQYEQIYAPYATQEENKEMRKVLRSLLDHERSVNQSGGYVLYHATKPEHYALHYIDTQIYMLTHRLKGNLVQLPYRDMVILRQCLAVDSDPDLTLRNFKNPPVHGKNPLYVECRHPLYDINSEVRTVLLACNSSPFANYDVDMACSYYYWLNKMNCMTVQWDYAKWIQSYHSLEPILREKQAYFETAIMEFAETSKTGVLLQLCFMDADLLKRVSYISHNFGYKYEQFEFGDCVISQTDTILKKLMGGIVFEKCRWEKNGLEYRLVLTQNLLLNPLHTDIMQYFSIKPYVANKQALNEFHAKVDALVAEIEKAVQH